MTPAVAPKIVVIIIAAASAAALVGVSVSVFLWRRQRRTKVGSPGRRVLVQSWRLTQSKAATEATESPLRLVPLTAAKREAVRHESVILV